MWFLTSQEKRLLSCVIIIFACGLFINYASKVNPHLWSMVNLLDSDVIRPRHNVNTATYEELLEVPTIGPVLSQRIINYRRSHGGGFHRLEELLHIKGIKKSQLKVLKKYLFL